MYWGEHKISEYGFEIMLNDSDSDYGIYAEDLKTAIELLKDELKRNPAAFIEITGRDAETDEIITLDRIKLHQLNQ